MAFALGGNVGRPLESLRWALGELEGIFGPLRIAPLYRTAPVSPVEQPDFLNTVALAEGPGSWTPPAILRKAKELETRAGRRAGVRFGPRPLDVDLLLYGNVCLDEPGLHFLVARLGWRALIVRFFGRVESVDLRLDQEYLRSQPVNSEEGITGDAVDRLYRGRCLS